MFCPNCGAELPDGSAFCASCGKPISSEQTARTPQPPASSEQPQPAAAQPQDQQGQQAQGAAAQPQGQQAQANTQQAQPGYQQPGYQQPGYQQPSQQKIYAQTTGTSRALAMSIYWGMLPLIFAAAVADKDTDPFIKHHLNQGLVLFLGGLIAALLSIIIIGGLLAIYLLVMVIMGTVQAYNGEMTELPLIGKIKIIK